MNDSAEHRRYLGTLQRRLFAFICGAAAAAIVAHFVSSDWCLLAFLAALCGGSTAACLDGRLAKGAGASRYRPAAFLIWTGVGVAAAVATTLTLGLRPTRAFEWAFGVAPSENVTRLQAMRRYAGGPGDMEIVLCFLADRATLDSLLAVRGFRGTASAKAHSARDHGDVATLLRTFFPLTSDKAIRTWKNTATSTAPEVFQWRSAQTCEQVNVVYDGDSGLTLVCYMFG